LHLESIQGRLRRNHRLILEASRVSPSSKLPMSEIVVPGEHC
jgi:hypothetical protein